MKYKSTILVGEWIEGEAAKEAIDILPHPVSIGRYNLNKVEILYNSKLLLWIWQKIMIIATQSLALNPLL